MRMLSTSAYDRDEDYAKSSNHNSHTGYSHHIKKYEHKPQYRNDYDDESDQLQGNSLDSNISCRPQITEKYYKGRSKSPIINDLIELETENIAEIGREQRLSSSSAYKNSRTNYPSRMYATFSGGALSKKLDKTNNLNEISHFMNVEPSKFHKTEKFNSNKMNLDYDNINTSQVMLTEPTESKSLNYYNERNRELPSKYNVGDMPRQNPKDKNHSKGAFRESEALNKFKPKPNNSKNIFDGGAEDEYSDERTSISEKILKNEINNLNNEIDQIQRSLVA